MISPWPTARLGGKLIGAGGGGFLMFYAGDKTEAAPGDGARPDCRKSASVLISKERNSSSRKYCAGNNPQTGRALLAVMLFFCMATAAFAGTVVADLRCDYAVNPLGVDSANPRLFWKLESNAARPAADRISNPRRLVAQNNLAHDDGDLWDSGKVSSDETIQIPYAGAALKSSQQVFWKVRVWDEDGKVSAWSKPATWTMGVLQAQDWQAQMDWRGGHKHSVAAFAPRIYREART